MAIDESRWSSPPTDPDPGPLGAGIDFSDPDSSLATWYMGTTQVIAIGILGLVFLFLNFVPLWHTDIWGHLQFGKWIVQNGQLPEGNPFCPLQDQEVDSNHYSWLGQTTLYLVYHMGESLTGGDAIQQMAGGVEALRFTHALLVLLKLTILLAAFYRVTDSLSVSLIGLVLMILIGGGNLAIARPQVFGELCFALVLFALSRPTLARPALIWIPLLMVLWANLHGSYAIGLILLSLFLAGKTIELGLEQRSWNVKALLLQPRLKPLWIVLAASIIGIGVLNPAGPWIYWRTIAMTNHPVVLLMDEWRPLSFSLGGGGHWSYLVTIVLLIGSLISARQWPAATAILLTLFFGLQPLLHQRALVWWLLLFPWVMLPLWVSQPADFLIGWFPMESTASFRKTIVALALAFVVLLWSIPGQWLVSGQPSSLARSVSNGTPWKLGLELKNDPALKEAYLPELDQWLEKHYEEGRFQGSLFTSETMGDYLVWALPKDMPVFIYAHVHLFTKEHWARCAAVRSGSEHWDDVLDNYHINLVVVEAELNQTLRENLHESADWQVLLDEAEDQTKVDKRCRLLVAVRKEPLRPQQMTAR